MRARAARDLGERLAPAVGQLVVGDQQLAHDRVAHERDQLVLVADVVVERHRAGAELGGDAAHRDGLEALRVGDPSAAAAICSRVCAGLRSPGAGRVQIGAALGVRLTSRTAYY